MFKIFFFIILLILLYIPYTRCALCHPVASIYYLIKDVFNYFSYRKWREFKGYGKIICATALFGGGKTLTTTLLLRTIYKKYNNKIVYNRKTKQWVTQHIIVHSNVNFTDIDFVPLVSTQDIIDVSNNFCDDNFMDVHLFLIDEASTQLNSRSFKKNFDNPDLLNTILTCRHVKIGIYLTAQRFNHVDALMRQVTSVTQDCAHVWRLYRINFYDAWSVENTTNINLVQPLYTRTYFIRDKDYAAYDTFAIVDNLIKSQKVGDMETPNEILCKRDISFSDDPRAYYRKRINKKINKL